MTTSPNYETPTEVNRDEALFAKLRLMGVDVKPKHAWMKSIGWAKNDPIYDEAMRLGAEWRAAENRKSLEELDALDAHS